MQNEIPNPDGSADNQDSELQSALLAAFGDEALDLLDDESPAMVPDVLTISENDPPRIQWIKRVNSALYEAGAFDPASTTGNDESRFLLFEIADRRFGIPLHSLVELNRYPRVTELPRTPGWLHGVTHFRGQVLSVTDLRSLLQIGGQRPVTGEKIIVIRDNKNTQTALVADQVLGLFNLPDPPGDVDDLKHRVAIIASGTTMVEGKETVLISPDQLFSCAQLAAFAT